MLLLGTHGIGVAAAIGLRAGNHPGFGRLVLDLPEGWTATARQEGDRIIVRFLGTDQVDPPDPAFLAAHNMRDVVVVPGGLAITVAHGVRLRVSQPAGRLVMDLMDTPRPASLSASRGAVSSLMQRPPGSEWPLAEAVTVPPNPTVSEGVLQAGPAMAVVASAFVGSSAAGAAGQVAAVSPPQIVQVKLPLPAQLPSALSAIPSTESPFQPHDVSAARPSPSEAESSAEPVSMVPRSQPLTEAPDRTPLALAAMSTPTSMSLPFSASTGAAAFSRGGWSYVVFDERRPIDISGHADVPGFPQASVQLLADATMLRFRSVPEVGLSLSHEGPDWKLTLKRGAARSFKPRLTETGLMLPAQGLGRVVAVGDPDGGGNLLIGTLRQAGEAVPAMRRTTSLILWPTSLGVVAEPLLDSIEVRAAPEGFVITAGMGANLGLSDGFLPTTAAGGSDDLTRQFDLPALPVAALLRRLQVTIQAAAAAPAQARTDKRLAVAQAMLALGMGAEAQGVTGLAARDDPRAAARPDMIAVAAAAALLAGRVAEGDAITDERLPETDETAFWRGVRAAMRAQDTAAAASVLASRVGLLIAYPAPLRERLLALVSETLVAGGQATAFTRLAKALDGDPRLALAQAMSVKPGPLGLTGLDALSASADRRLRDRAIQLAAEQRLSLGLADLTATANALEHVIYAWRGDGAEIALRERVAELRAQGGTPRAALKMLRETAGLWPEHAARLSARMAELLEAAVAPDARPLLSPLAFVSMVEENADLLPEGAAGERLAALLSERLGALELPERAANALAKLVSTAPPGGPRAALGARQASLRLARDDPAGALSALRDSDAPALPLALRETREFIRAQAQVAQNDRGAALATLAPLHGSDAVILRGTLLESARDWAGAAKALRTLTAGFTANGGLDDGQAKLLLRVASDAAQAGDEDELRQLHEEFQDRMPVPELARVFALLTEKPVRELSDLSRAKREVASARQLHGQLDALSAGKPVAR